MKLYLYSYIDALRDILSNNIILCNQFSKKDRNKSLSYAFNNGLLITNRKLNEKCRNLGLEESLNEGDIPVILELNFLDEILNKIPCKIIFKNEKEKVEFQEGTLADYNEASIGALIKGFIPFEYISKIMFEKDKHFKFVKQPSNDLWYPEEIYDVIKQEEFVDEIQPIKEIENDFVLTDEDKNVFLQFNKERASAYYLIQGTENYNFEKYEMNIDKYLASFLNIKNEDIEKSNKIFETEKVSNIFKMADKNDVFCNEKGFEYQLFLKMKEILSSKNQQTVFNEEESTKIVEDLKTVVPEEYKDNFESIDKLIRSTLYSNEENFDATLNTLYSCYPMAALLLVLKNPHFNDSFITSFDAYNVKCSVKRLALILFGSINGFDFIEGKYKSNYRINRIIDSKKIIENSESLNNSKMINFIYEEQTYSSIFDNKPKMNEFDIRIEKIVSFDDVFELVSNYTIAEKKKIDLVVDYLEKNKMIKVFTYRIIKEEKVKDLSLIGKNQKEIETIVKELSRISKDENNYDFNYDQFITDNLKNKKVFKKLYDQDIEFWKSVYEGRI